MVVSHTSLLWIIGTSLIILLHQKYNYRRRKKCSHSCALISPHPPSLLHHPHNSPPPPPTSPLHPPAQGCYRPPPSPYLLPSCRLPDETPPPRLSIFEANSYKVCPISSIWTSWAVLCLPKLTADPISPSRVITLFSK